MKKYIQRIIGLVLALAIVAGFALVPSPMDVQAEAATVPSTKLCDYVQDGVTLHCWNWSIANIKANLGLIASMGYSSIQLSPLQELKEGTVNKPVNNWWAVYQPISFNINESESHAIGTKSELIDLCNEAHKYGIKVIMDVVCNHTANNGNNTLCPMVDPEILNDPACWHDYKTNSWDYGNRYNITQYCMAGLPDLNTANQKVQDKALAMLKAYIDCGVDGFRFDAAKQIETPDDHSSFASDFWPTVINGASDYAAQTRNIMLYNYGELLENPDNSGSLHISAYTKYMSVTESVWSNDVRYKLEAHSAAALRKAYFKEANADKLVLWAESHDTVGDGSSIYSTDYNIAKAWSLVASRAYTMSLYFPRPNSMVNLANDATIPQEMGEMAKIGWNSAVTQAVNRFHNHFAGQSEYLTQDTTANLYYNERGNSGVIITNFNDGGRDINLPVYAMANGTYYDQITGNKFTVNGGRIYGSMGDTGIAVVYNPASVNCTHAKHGLDGYCYSCFTYVGHKSGTKCSVCGTASTRTIYFENTDGWKNVYVYGWHDNDTTITSAWPGNKMTKVEGNLYSIEIPTTATNIIFNNNGTAQTANLVPSASDDTYHYDTAFWTTKGEVVSADNYYLFYATSTDAYNGYDYRFVDGKLTMSFDETSYVWLIDSNGQQYMTDGWQGNVTSAVMMAPTADANKLAVPGGVNVTFTMVNNGDGTITLSYTTGESTGGSGDSGNTGSDTITIYFQNNWMWSNVSAYYWGGKNPCGSWPGNAMKKFGNDGTYDIYSIEIPADITGLIINGVKNDGSGAEDKTPDITYGWYDGICYYMDWNNGNIARSGHIDDFISTACDHTYTSKVTKAATCDKEGVKTFTCSKCGESYIESIPATGHSYSEKITTAATCTSSGVKTFTCSKCGDSYTTTFAATGHSYTGKVTKQPTCTAYGVKTFTCANCKDSYTEEIAPNGHSFSNGKCSVCGAVDPNCEHTYTSKVTKAATCLEAGVKTFTCSKCGDVYTEDIPAKGHDYVKTVTAPTCENNGYTTYTCKSCNYHYSTDAVNPIGHAYSTVVTPPTCTEDGYTTYTCGNCGHVYTWNVVPAFGHYYVGGTCTTCGGKDASYAPDYFLVGYINGANYGCEEDHANVGAYKFTNGKLVTTFTEDSYVFVKTGDNVNWYLAEEFCEGTSVTLIKDEMEKLFVPGKVEITFNLVVNANGTLTLSYVKGEPAACQHVYTNAVTKQASCTESGVRTYTCVYCNDTYTETIAAWGHSFSGGTCTTCGAADPSYVAPDYYLFGYINGADYGCRDDLANLGEYKFVDGKVTVKFTQESYVAVKTSDNKSFYMTNGYVGEATSAILYKFTDPDSVSANKLMVSGGQTVTFTLSKNWDGNLIISYTVDSNDCHHSSHNQSGNCTTCGTAVEHTYNFGVCTVCGLQDPSYVPYEYYLFGFINGANYGCEEDGANIGTYKFVDGKLTVTFDSDSYVAIKEVNPGAKFGPEVVGWYMTEEYVTGSSATFINTNNGGMEKMFVPGGVEVTFNLTVNEDGTLTLSYVADVPAVESGYVLVTDPSQITAGGKFVIVANGMAMGTTLSSGKFVGTAVTIDGNVVTGTDLPIWTIEAVDGGIALSVDGQYLTYNSSTNFKFATSAYTWTVAAGENGFVLNSAATTRGIYFQISSSKFGAYATSNANSASYVSQLQLYKYMELPTECDHNYVGGTCTKCGEKDPNYVPVVVPTITLKTPTLLLEDTIKLNIYYTIDQDIPLEKMGMITWKEKPSVVDISTADAVYPGATFNTDNGFFGVNTDGIPAQDLGDIIYFCIYAELADGSIAYGKQVQYSPTTYAYNQLKGGATPEMKALLVAILNYGAAAQVYLEDTDPLVTSDMTDAMKALIEEYRADMVHSVGMPSASKQGAMAANGGFSAKKPTIALDGAFSINYYFTPSKAVAGEMTFYYWNAADFAAADVLSTSNATGSMVMTEENGTYGAAIQGIAAKDIDSALYACGVYTDASGNTYSTGILPYSLGFYCGNQAKGDGALADLASAIAVYGYYAAAYFAQ